MLKKGNIVLIPVALQISLLPGAKERKYFFYLFVFDLVNKFVLALAL